MPAIGLNLGLRTARAVVDLAFGGVLESHSTDLLGAWSLNRRLLASYSGPLLRVRRASDSAEIDIGYNSAGELDVAALNLSCNGSDGHLVTCYDQSGGGCNLTQATAAHQSPIWDGINNQFKSTVSTSGKLAARVADAFTDYEADFGSQQNPDSVTFSFVGDLTNSDGGYNGILDGPGASYEPGGAILLWQLDSTQVQPYQSFSVRGGVVAAAGGMPYILGVTFGPNSVDTYRSGLVVASGAYVPSFNFSRFRVWEGSLNTGGGFAELILWKGNRTTALSEVATNQQTYFGL